MTATARHRILSGMQPSADSLHLGNYIGALRELGGLQDEYDAIFFIPDLHAITVPQDPAELAQRTRVDGRAVHRRPASTSDKCTLFVQSHVPEHAQLAWVLNCITGFGEASRMTQFKDKTQKSGRGAATRRPVRVPDPDGRGHPAVPDRRRARWARTSASTWSSPATWPSASTPASARPSRCPRPSSRRTRAKIYDLQNPTAKMSKSAESPAGAIQLLDDPKITAKRIKSAVTDAETEIRFDRETKPGVSNLLTIYSALTGQSVAAAGAAYQGKMYGHLKVDLAEVVVDFLTPIRDRDQRAAGRSRGAGPAAGARCRTRPGKSPPSPSGRLCQGGLPAVRRPRGVR